MFVDFNSRYYDIKVKSSQSIDIFIKDPNSCTVENHYSIAKIISSLEKGTSIPHQFFEDNASKNRNCITVGITGGAGVGKSSFINKLTSYIIQSNHSVGIILIDPSSKLTKGTFLGDRIRISPDCLEKKVYIRSLSTLNSVSNIPEYVRNVIQCMRIIGFDFILLETIGISQNDNEIKKYVDHVIVIPSNEDVDWIQQYKSSAHEIADIYFINKNDTQDTNKVEIAIKEYLELTKKQREKPPRIIRGSSIDGEGIREVFENLSEKLRVGIESE